ncbi:MAG TPA: pentapeptide repeat-containing protein [Acidobacteriaceae bacterium]|nr:pentapeptide repeat-containing protein [Acidobacteriaceae bacterium]
MYSVAMAGKPKGRIAPRIDEALLTETFFEQLASGTVHDALVAERELPSLSSPRGQAASMEGCLWRAVMLSDPKAQRLRLRDARIEQSDLANIDMTGAALERIEILATRLTGATCGESQLKSVLFQECKLDFALFRMAHLERCVFEKCNLIEADFYGADLTGAIFRGCDLSRADISHATLTGADLRDCRLDGMRGKPVTMDGLIISPDQAALLITLFGVRVQW